MIRDTILAAKARRVSIGANQSFMHLCGFCRRRISGERPEDIEAQLIYQIAAIQGMAEAYDFPITHVKTYGALANMAAEDEELARSVPRRSAMLLKFQINAIGPALIAKHFPPRLNRQSRSIAIVLSPRVISIGDNRLGGWISYHSSKASLNQMVRMAAIELSCTHPQAVIAVMHPGTVQTRPSAPYFAKQPTASPDQATTSIMQAADCLNETGKFIA